MKLYLMTTRHDTNKIIPLHSGNSSSFFVVACLISLQSSIKQISRFFLILAQKREDRTGKFAMHTLNLSKQNKSKNNNGIRYIQYTIHAIYYCITDLLLYILRAHLEVRTFEAQLRYHSRIFLANDIKNIPTLINVDSHLYLVFYTCNKILHKHLGFLIFDSFIISFQRPSKSHRKHVRSCQRLLF